MSKNRRQIIIDGKQVRYSLLQNRLAKGDENWFVHFRGPDDNRLEKATGTPDMAIAETVAPGIIAKAYSPEERERKEKAKLPTVTWAEAEESIRKAMQAGGLRPNTIKDYVETVRLFKKMNPEIDGPHAVNEAHCKAFKASRMGNKDISPVTVYHNIIKLSTVFDKWLSKELGLLQANPWANVETPKFDKPTKRAPLTYAEEDAFIEWLKIEWGGWMLPVLYFRVKFAIGCRSLELASLETSQLRDGRIYFSAEQTKGREERACLLPSDLYAALLHHAGKKYLFGNAPQHLQAYYRKQGGRCLKFARLVREFDPARFAVLMSRSCAKYNKECKDTNPKHVHFTPHKLRGTAMSRAVDAFDGDFNAAAVAFDCEVATIKSNYATIDKVRIADKVFATIQKRA